MNEKKLTVVNVRRVKYGNSPAEMPVKETQTYCTCGSKSVSVYASMDLGVTTLACGTLNPILHHFSVFWERVLCLPLNREHLFEGESFCLMRSCLVCWRDGNESH